MHPRRLNFWNAVLLFAITLHLSPLSIGVAQQILTLDQSLERAFEQSFLAKNARAQLQASEAAAQAARKALYSTVDFEMDIPNFASSLAPQFNPLTNRTEFFPLEILQWTARLNISQPIIWTNSTLSVSGLLYRQDQKDNTLGGSLYRDFYTNIAIILRQPVFVPNTQRISLRRAEIEYEEALLDYRKNTLDLRFTVTESFYRTYAAQEQLRIQNDRVIQQRQSHATAMRKYKSGLIAEVEALQFEVDLAAAQNDLLSAQNDFLSRLENFRITIGLMTEDSVSLALADTSFREISIDLQTAVVESKRTRADYVRARNNIERSELSLDEVSSRRSIRGDITLSYGLSKNDEVLRQLYIDPRETRGALFTLSVPVFDWGKHSLEVEAAEARLRSSELTAYNMERTITSEINDNVRRIRSAAERVKLLFKSREVAEKAAFINTKRFEVGTIGSTELSQSQTRLLQARLSALEALIDYNVSLADLTRRTSHNFATNREVEIVP